MSTKLANKRNTTILAIETSCDETAAAVLTVRGKIFDLRSNVVASQIPIHRRFGGVVPEVAARNHVGAIIPIITQALKIAQLNPQNIDRIAVTAGPGLITSLLVGVETARALSYAWGKPLVPVNHMRAHLYANWLHNTPIKFPAMGLIVSGGHTELIYIKSAADFKKIGQTVDDAAGEAFDKVGALLKLGYPGGPIVSQRAKRGDRSTFAFPRPMLKSNDFNFSFSGLKTAVLYASKKITLNQKTTDNICASFQQAVVDVLSEKTFAATKRFGAKTILVAGGVAANELLRTTMATRAKKEGYTFLIPRFEWCTDNAAMIAAAGYFAPIRPRTRIHADPNLSI